MEPIAKLFARIAKISLGLQKFRNPSENIAMKEFRKITVHSEIFQFRYDTKFSLS